MAKTTLVAPCEPSTAAVHRHHPAHALGRIRRHGTGRTARRLHAGTGGCLPGSITLLKAGLVPVAALTATAAVGAVAVTGPPASWMGSPDGVTFPGAGPDGGAGGGSITITHHGHHHVITVPEPSGLPVLLIAVAAWGVLRRWGKSGFR